MAPHLPLTARRVEVLGQGDGLQALRGRACGHLGGLARLRFLAIRECVEGSHGGRVGSWNSLREFCPHTAFDETPVFVP